MITDIFLKIIGWIFAVISFLLPNWSVWDNSAWSFSTMFITIGQAFARLNFILAIDTLFQAIDYFLYFEIIYLSALLTIKVIIFFRTGDFKI